MGNIEASPYVCAEWEFGGYPYWLQNETGLVVRSTEIKYLNEYRKYINAIGKQLAPFQVNHGGNVLMVQIENEYGSYGQDKAYLETNRKLFVAAGFDGLLYTCDPAGDVAKGHLPGLLPAVNGIDDPEKVEKLIRENHNGKGPFFIAEWYPAWFDWWGTKHHTVPAEKYVAGLERVLAHGMSINMYMFHGGTTRGFMNGANFNDKNPYEPQISSYDYDAPLDEAGNATPKFWAFRKVIQKYLPKNQALPEVPQAKPTISINDITLSEGASIFDMLPSPKKNDTPLTFEAMQQAYGYMLYRTSLNNQSSSSQIVKIKELRDYAIVFINGKRVGVLDRREYQDSLTINLPEGTAVIDILVENMGRVNFGPYLLKNKKGITEKVLLNNKELKGWQMFALPFNNINNIKIKVNDFKDDQPQVKEGSFNLPDTGDTYLDMSNWGKGMVWVNGHNLGRYWSIGPQQTLYIPVEWLKKGENKITVLELLKSKQDKLNAKAEPILNVLQQK